MPIMVVMDVFTRRIIGFGVDRADLCGVSVCRMFNRIIAGKALPRHLSCDHDPLFRFDRWRANLRILEVEEIRSVPYVPVSHPFVERLIGTIRREFLDQVLIWNAVDLGRKLEEFRIYYNEHRAHQSLNGSTPNVLANRRPPLPSFTATLGGTTAAVCSRCQSRRDLRIRHGHANAPAAHATRDSRDHGQKHTSENAASVSLVDVSPKNVSPREINLTAHSRDECPSVGAGAH